MKANWYNCFRKKRALLDKYVRNALSTTTFGSLFLVVSICLTSLTCCGKVRADWAAEPYKTADAASVGEDAGRTLSTFNETISVAILIGAVMYAVYYLRTSSNTKGRQKMGSPRRTLPMRRK